MTYSYDSPTTGVLYMKQTRKCVVEPSVSLPVSSRTQNMHS